MKLWFKAKTYGYGWTPCSWEGWLTLALYIILSVGTYFVIDAASFSERDAALVFLPLILIYTLVLLLICYRTGERPRWRWGGG